MCVCVCVCVCVYKQITILLLRAFRNLKLAIIFKIFLPFYLLLYLIILSKNIFFKELYIIFLLSRASHRYNISII